MYPNDRLYSEEHEWILVEDGVGTVGITDFAQDELGEVVYFEMPEAGATFEAGDEIGSIESVKAVSEVYTPVSGEIVEPNGAVDESPEIVNSEPHGDGWLFKIRLSAPDELENLMNAEQYEALVTSKDED